MKRPRRTNLTTYALFANAVMLGLILIVLLSRDESPRWLNAAFAQTPGTSLTPQPIAGGAGLFLMPAQFFTNMWGCYVMDVDAQTLAARAEGFTPPPPKYPTGVLAKYRKLVGSAAGGAVCG